jgi:hypothetical protein
MSGGYGYLDKCAFTGEPCPKILYEGETKELVCSHQFDHNPFPFTDVNCQRHPEKAEAHGAAIEEALDEFEKARPPLHRMTDKVRGAIFRIACDHYDCADIPIIQVQGLLNNIHEVVDRYDVDDKTRSRIMDYVQKFVDRLAMGRRHVRGNLSDEIPFK